MSIDKNQRQNCYKRHYWLLYKLHSLCTEPRNKDVKYHNTLNENWFSNLCENGSKNMTFLSEFYSPRNTRFKQKKMTLKVPLKECMCCEKVQLPGECTTRPFLQTAELVLLDHIGKTNPFDVKDLHAFPKVITKIGDQEERGFIAEFKVYEEIIKSNLPIYIFYSLKPIDKNEELGDFLLVTNSSVIVLEVKAFELHTNPSKQDYEIIQKILSKPKNKAKDNVNLKITQKERVTKEIETFLKKHDCKLPTIKYFTLFVNIKRPEEATINFEDALFQDNYLQEIKGLSTIKAEYNAANESSQYSLRMLLAWFYGTYLQSYIKLGTLKLEEDGIVKKELDEEYKQKAKRMNKDVSGIFLTPAQKVIVESNQPYLQITGLPGTGKTYCLLLKMVQVFFELWQLRRQNPNSAKEIIIVFHRNDITIQFIKRMFWQTVEKQLARIVFKKSEEMSNLIRFIGGKNLIDIDSKALFYVDNYELDPTFKIFIDDVSADIINFDDTNRIYELFKAIDYSNFCWYTSYSVIPMLKNFYQPLSLLKIENNKMSHSGRQVYLTDSLRYTACIHALLDVVLDRNESIDVGDLKYPKFERKNFSPGTRVIGKTPQFVLVEDSKDLENKVKELHQYLLEEGLQRNEIAVIRTDVIYEDLLEEIGIGKDGSGAPEYSDEVLSYLKGLSTEDSNIDHGFTSMNVHSISSAFERRNDHCTFSLRGLEVNYVIVCITKKPFSFKNYHDDLLRLEVQYCMAKNEPINHLCKHLQRQQYETLWPRFTPSNTSKSISQEACKQWEDYRMVDFIEAISRAVAGVTIFHTDGDLMLSEIANSFKRVYPAICPTSTYKKIYMLDEIIKKYEPLHLETICKLDSVNAAYEFYYFYFSYRLIRFPTNQICSLDVSHDLRCINSLMEKLCCDNDSEFTFKNLIIKMMVYGQLIVLLDAIIDNFDDYKHINVNFSYPLNKRFDIQLVDDDTKEYLEAWKRQLQATTVDDAISMLEQNGHISMLEEKEEIRAQFKKIHDHSISFLVKILIFILETALFPLLPIIAQNDFHSSKELLNKSQRMNWPTFPFQSNSWSYETISSRKITKFEFTHSFLNSSDKILNTLILDGNEGETRIKMIQYQNNQRLEQKSEAIFNLTSELKTRLNQKEMSDTIHHYYYLFPFGSNLPFDTDEKTLFLDELIHALSNNRRSAFLDILIEHLTLSWKHLNKICSIEPPESVGGFSKDVLNPLRKLNQILRCFQKVRLSFNKLLSLPNQTFRGNELKFFKQSKLEGN
ncbi:uncharacterized protein LOC136030924 isoform X2 [Artemia franciscana]|uniref:Uncharacterized protein n=1 Tax=Artemia franciscana TaxID=6661 RepID=A0AA88KSR8_ARTSF|nr:hypothetical protein QYM36_017270 [Artemia franciscana]